MNQITNTRPTAELQALDAAHHIHPFTAQAALAAKGTRVIREAKGIWLRDSDGEPLLDGMAGLWCVNIGYGRHELAEAAARQMKELPYYNAFFQTSHVPVIELAAKLAQLIPGDLNHTFFASSGSEANDTNLRLVQRYYDLLGKPEKYHHHQPQERLPRLAPSRHRLPGGHGRPCTSPEPRPAHYRTSSTSTSRNWFEERRAGRKPGRFRCCAVARELETENRRTRARTV